MKSPVTWIFALFLAWCAPCHAAAIWDQPPLKLQAYQARNFDASRERTFNATFEVLQDLGCIITSADLQTGYISARSPYGPSFIFRNSTGLSLTAFVTKRPKGGSRVRLTAVTVRGAFFGTAEFPVVDMTVYERFFARVLQTLSTQRGDLVN